MAGNGSVGSIENSHHFASADIGRTDPERLAGGEKISTERTSFPTSSFSVLPSRQSPPRAKNKSATLGRNHSNKTPEEIAGAAIRAADILAGDRSINFDDLPEDLKFVKLYVSCKGEILPNFRIRHEKLKSNKPVYEEFCKALETLKARSPIPKKLGKKRGPYTMRDPEEKGASIIVACRWLAEEPSRKLSKLPSELSHVKNYITRSGELRPTASKKYIEELEKIPVLHQDFVESRENLTKIHQENNIVLKRLSKTERETLLNSMTIFTKNLIKFKTGGYEKLIDSMPPGLTKDRMGMLFEQDGSFKKDLPARVFQKRMEQISVSHRQIYNDFLAAYAMPKGGTGAGSAQSTPLGGS